MKEVKIITTATIITCVLMLLTGCLMPVQAEEAVTAGSRPEFYPKLTIVVDTIRITDGLWVVNCQDREGNLWAFFDNEGTWEEGDLANLLMWAVSEIEEEDEVVEVYWEGYVEDIATWLQMEGWH